VKKSYRGRIWIFDDDVDTDQIYPGPYLALTSEEEIAQHAMEGTPKGKQFLAESQPGDILVAGRNFGSGSSREHAPLSIKLRGISVVIARSFARIFYRNAINIGLPIITADLSSLKIHDGDTLEVQWPEGRVIVVKQNTVVQGEPLRGLEIDIVSAGGVLEYLKNRKLEQ
jgi:3-isopropylmalate/(R)-2-methylmalate dehydratase small subunit